MEGGDEGRRGKGKEETFMAECGSMFIEGNGSMFIEGNYNGLVKDYDMGHGTTVRYSNSHANDPQIFTHIGS